VYVLNDVEEYHGGPFTLSIDVEEIVRGVGQG